MAIIHWIVAGPHMEKRTYLEEAMLTTACRSTPGLLGYNYDETDVHIPVRTNMPPKNVVAPHCGRYTLTILYKKLCVVKL